MSKMLTSKIRLKYVKNQNCLKKTVQIRPKKIQIKVASQEYIKSVQKRPKYSQKIFTTQFSVANISKVTIHQNNEAHVTANKYFHEGLNKISFMSTNPDVLFLQCSAENFCRLIFKN